MRLSRPAVEARESLIRQIGNTAEQVEKPYKLYFGESDMTTPEFICQAATEAMKAGHTFYTPTAGFLDLRKAIVNRPDHQFVQAFTENLMTYALGRSLDYRDMPTIRRIVRESAADNYRFRSIVLGVVSSDAFRKREAEDHEPAPVKPPVSSASANGGPVVSDRPQRGVQ